MKELEKNVSSPSPLWYPQAYEMYLPHPVSDRFLSVSPSLCDYFPIWTPGLYDEELTLLYDFLLANYICSSYF